MTNYTQGLENTVSILRGKRERKISKIIIILTKFVLLSRVAFSVRTPTRILPTFLSKKFLYDFRHVGTLSSCPFFFFRQWPVSAVFRTQSQTYKQTRSRSTFIKRIVIKTHRALLFLNQGNA